MRTQTEIEQLKKLFESLKVEGYNDFIEGALLAIKMITER